MKFNCFMITIQVKIENMPIFDQAETFVSNNIFLVKTFFACKLHVDHYQS